MEASAKTKRNKFEADREQARLEWLSIWGFYQDLKVKHNLTSQDILKQLDAPCTIHNLKLLSKNGDKNIPSNKPGTNGRESRDLLLSGLEKTNWLPPVQLTYIEKLTVMQSEGCFRNYSIHIIDNNDLHPVLEIGIMHEEYYTGNCIYHHDKKEFAKLFTIDGTVPEIRDIKDFYWC